MSTGDEASVFARFHFRPHFLQHSGFRLVASDYEAPATHLYAGQFEGQAARASQREVASEDENPNISNVYETDASLNMYLGLHYGDSGRYEKYPSILEHNNSPSHALRFPQRVASLLAMLKPKQTNNRALDIGCAVGGSSFELARSFDRVDAFDFSFSFIRAAKQMQTDPDSVYFRIPTEADLFEEVRAVHSDGVTPEVRSRVHFFTGDACKIDEMVGNELLSMYDGIVMSNLLCRLPDPMACLAGLSNVVNPGGILVLVTPFSWLTDFTPRSKWLGGFLDPVSKQPIHSKDVLQTIMYDRGFELVHEEEMPLLIREHQRKYQYIISLATGWRKVG